IARMTGLDSPVVQELEVLAEFDTLYFLTDTPRGALPIVVEKEKKVYRVQGFSCANCAGKFENNVKKLPEVQDAKVNFGASKISVYGSATVEELEEAGAFENLKVVPEKSREESGQDKKEKE